MFDTVVALIAAGSLVAFSPQDAKVNHPFGMVIGR